MNTLLIRKIRQIKSLFTDQQTLIYLLSFVVGLVSALAAVVMKNTIHFTHELFTQGVMRGAGGVLSIAYPLFGIALTVLTGEVRGAGQHFSRRQPGTVCHLTSQKLYQEA
ncbi:MAG: hypothetical protein U5L72_20180 [Bacteroidales bacterium]|nr:hypothetical protein [Bacteroidales bacterium]